MLDQTRDLISSRCKLEDDGESFYCADCGEPLPTVREAYVSDFCTDCEPIEVGRQEPELDAPGSPGFPECIDAPEPYDY